MPNQRKNQFVFCVSPGRSGTNYLAQVFNTVPENCSVHEPEHQFAEFKYLSPKKWDLRNTRFKDSYNERSLLKLGQIQQIMSKENKTSYSETNPLFSTLWHDVIMSELSGHDVAIIILRSNIAEVLKSLFDLGWYGERDGDDRMVSPYSVNTLFRSPVPEGAATQFDKIMGYLVNVELYAQHIKTTCKQKGYRVAEINSTEMFTDSSVIMQLLDFCSFTPDRKALDAVIGKKLNKSGAKKKYSDVLLDECIYKATKFLELCAIKGLYVPPSLLEPT